MYNYDMTMYDDVVMSVEIPEIPDSGCAERVGV